jgi:hypothetical protein
MVDESVAVSDEAGTMITRRAYKRTFVEWWHVDDRFVARVDGKDAFSMPAVRYGTGLGKTQEQDASLLTDALFKMTDEESDLMMADIFRGCSATTPRRRSPPRSSNR